MDMTLLDIHKLCLKYHKIDAFDPFFYCRVELDIVCRILLIRVDLCQHRFADFFGF